MKVIFKNLTNFKGHLVLLLFLSILPLSQSYSAYPAPAANTTGYKVAGASSCYLVIQISAVNYCEYITNANALTIFVPTGTQAEYQGFRSAVDASTVTNVTSTAPGTPGVAGATLCHLYTTTCATAP